MSARVRVATDEGGAVAVKSARMTDERTALRYEAELLQRCGHPGVVAVVRPDDVEELLAAGELWLRYAGDPVDRWRGDLRQTAGLAAAIAATVGDLHDMDVVHGRLDGSHVLVGADGRPRLCGFAPPGDQTPADDVLALGRVVADLVDRIAPSEPRWPLWRRGDVADRRALDDVVRRANDEVADRRPSARTMAAALLAAVPGAALPTSPRAGSGFTRSPGEATERLSVPPAADPAEDRTEPLAHLLALRADDPTEPVAADDDGHGGSSGSDAEAEVDAFVAAAEVAERGGLRGPGAFDDQRSSDVDPLFGDQRSAQDDDVFADRPWPAVRTDRHPPRRPPSMERRPPTRERSLPRVVLATAVVGVGAVVAGALLLQAGRPAARAASSAAPPTSCQAAAAAADADLVVADIDGDGCDDGVRIVDGVVQVEDQRWAVAGADDSIAIGDWDCDGRATPAVYQRATGDVFVFPAWADSSGPLEVEAAASVPGADQIGASSGDEPCPELTVEMPGGERRTVEVPR